MLQNPGKKVKCLSGNTYERKGYRLYIAFPKIPHVHSCMSRDVLRDEPLDILKVNNKKYYGITYNRSLGLYICWRLRFISYNKLEDLKFSHLHGNKYNSKNAKTYGVNGYVNRVSKNQ